MSDDPKEIPPSKLRLSRDLKDPPETGEVKKDPTIKLKRKVDKAAPTAPTARKQPPPPTFKTEKEPSEAPHTDAATPPGKEPRFDPNKPFGYRIKSDEIKSGENRAAPPPRPIDCAPRGSAPQIEDNSAARLEETVHSLNSQTAPGSKNGGLVASVVVILILLLMVFGAGFGLWKLLQSPQTTEATHTKVTTKQEEEQKAAPADSKSPIEKAKKAIALVPVMDVDAITQLTPAPIPAASPAASPAGELAIQPAETTESAEIFQASETRETVSQTPSSAVIEANKQSVSQYLTGVHIGGVRKGDRPMILIEGERFLVGDIVQAETGLKFDGLRNGRLAFRDSHGIVYLKSF